MRRGLGGLGHGLEKLRSSHLKNADHTAPNGVSPEHLFPRIHHRCVALKAKEKEKQRLNTVFW